MKKFLFVALLCPFVANAQFTKGQMFLGGTFSGQGTNGQASGTDLGGTTRSIGGSAKVGWFFNEKWALGAALGYSYLRDNWLQNYPPYSTNQITIQKSFSATLFVRRYFAVTKKIFIALEGSAGYSRAGNSTVYNVITSPGGLVTTNSNAPTYSLGAGIAPLILFFPSPRWGFSSGYGNIGFSHQFNLSDHSTNNTFSFAFTPSFSIGVNYYFNREGKSE